MDKITDIDILEEKVKPENKVVGQEKGLNLPKHMAEHIYMYSGNSVTAKLDVPVKLMNELIDWFGKDFTIISKNEERMVIRISCNEDALLYWALQYGIYVEVLEPLELRERILQVIKDMEKRYARN